MMENVKNLIGKKNKPDFDKWCEQLEEQEYNNYYKVINAKNCGVPQNRERVFMVSIRKDVDDGSFKFEKDFDNGGPIERLIGKQCARKILYKYRKNANFNGNIY